jgi:uncharacterized protein (TIGR03437 family)
MAGDIVIFCTGGSGLAAGTAVPTVNITVTLGNTYVTSRVFGNGLSEALLLIDDPGLNIGGTTELPQNLCSGGALGAGPGGCATTVQPMTIGGFSTNVASTSTPATSTSVPNVFQGVVSVNSNQVVFNGIPFLAPVTAGYARVFRITNVRFDATALGAPGTMIGGVTMSGGILLSAPALTMSNVYAASSMAVRNASNSAANAGITLSPCAGSSLTPAAVLRFSEIVGTAFKTRISPASGLSGAGTPPNSRTTAATLGQNTPGFVYGGSESNLIFPVTGGTAGLADFGTRLKAVFRNVPAGVKIYVSTTNINPLANAGVDPSAGANLTAPATAVAAGNFAAVTNSVSLLAGLVTSETAVAAPGSALPLATATNTAGGVTLFGPLPVDGNGTATATWEVLLANPAAADVADFAVFYSVDGAAAGASTSSIELSTAPAFSTRAGSALIPTFAPPATSSPFVSSISACSAGIGLTSSANFSTYGQSVTFTAAVTASSGTPTGTMTFKDGAATLRTVTMASGQASLITSTLGAGTHSITAVYSGDSSFPALTSAAVSQVVNRAATAISVSVQNSAAVGHLGAITVMVSSTSGVPTGTVTCRDGAAILGGAILDGSGTARCFAPALALGGHAISATYAGDGNFLGSTSAAQFVNIVRSGVSIGTPVLRSGNPVLGELLTIAANVSADSPLGAALTFRDFTTPLGDAAIDASGNAVISVRLGLGRHSINAYYPGDSNNDSGVSGSLDLTIRGSAPLSLGASPTPTTVGTPVTLTATFPPPVGGNAAPTGTVTFSENGVTLGTAALASGQAVYTVSAGFAAGDHTIVASYGGDTNYLASSSTAVTVRVVKIATTTSIAEGIGSNGYFVSAQVAPVATGTVQFVDATAGATLGSAPVGGNSTSLDLYALLPVGHLVKAVYSGDAKYAASESAAQVFLLAGNGFSFQPTFAADALGSIFGASLAGSTAAAPGLPLGETLGGVTVRILDANGKSYAALLYYVSPGQLNFVIPADVPAGPATLVVNTPGGPLSLAVTITRSSPALTSADGSGSGAAAAQAFRSDGRLFLVLYGTGFRHSATPIGCSMNGQPVTPLFAGAHSVYPGLDQINLQIPLGLSGVLRITCSADGETSNVVTFEVPSVFP